MFFAYSIFSLYVLIELLIQRLKIFLSCHCVLNQPIKVFTMEMNIGESVFKMIFRNHTNLFPDESGAVMMEYVIIGLLIAVAGL